MRKYVGQIPKFTKRATIAIGSIPMCNAIFTIEGATKAPYKAKASIIPVAVDWILTENDSVSIHAIRQYAFAMYSKKVYLKKVWKFQAIKWRDLCFIWREKREKRLLQPLQLRRRMQFPLFWVFFWLSILDDNLIFT